MKGEIEKIKTLIAAGDKDAARKRLQNALRISPNNPELVQLQNQVNK